MARLLLLAAFATLFACGIKGAPKPSPRPAPRAEPPAPVQPLPARDVLQEGSLDGGLPDAGLDAGAAP